MAKFGLFDGSAETTLQEFEGEWLEVSGETVQVHGADERGTYRALHVVSMKPGWLVKKIG
jgi:hypothetical protein